MVTNAEEPEVETAGEQAEHIVRTIIAGHPQGAVRRILLYLILAACVVVGGTIDGAAGLASTGLAIVSVVLLATTDVLL